MAFINRYYDGFGRVCEEHTEWAFCEVCGRKMLSYRGMKYTERGPLSGRVLCEVCHAHYAPALLRTCTDAERNALGEEVVRWYTEYPDWVFFLTREEIEESTGKRLCKDLT